ncbi:Cysteine-rich secretory protein family protein [Paraliobacillus sp. PM-2]|uniref:CAP domain-containing protein n=1 Tax=Paraliobacillus sp. PM-2 TaxID=1462524 RepID=UPI00061B9BF2|nr:CAP-associated domain-containing protein [Paraliobacillus sp. PM-2]CQR47945.1 Cysteine-rich secretory protein family protein [Paraliobacillus sp. PM-2]
MVKFKFFILMLLFSGVFWYFYGDTLQENGMETTFYEVREDVITFKESPLVINTMNTIKQGYGLLVDTFTDKIENKDPSNDISVNDPTLKKPVEQTFSIYNIEVGDDRQVVESQIGKPKRMTNNQYGVKWMTYHENYHHFIMVAYDENDQVAGLYTNQPLLSSTQDISFDHTMEDVLRALNEPVSGIQKGSVNYLIEGKDEYDTFLIDNNYVTIFYDIHENHTVTAIQIIDKQLEMQKPAYFAEPSTELQQGLEYQLFDLTNAARVVHGLSPLTWDEAVLPTVREHSKDMAKNNYFGHTNLDEQSPFDRLQEDGIAFQMAGENLATGQPSSIYAHEGLMNSLGHRKNILNADYRLLTVGVAFNNDNQPFYTENFLTK